MVILKTTQTHLLLEMDQSKELRQTSPICINGLTLVLLILDIPYPYKQCRSRSVGFWRRKRITNMYMNLKWKMRASWSFCNKFHEYQPLNKKVIAVWKCRYCKSRTRLWVNDVINTHLNKMNYSHSCAIKHQFMDNMHSFYWMQWNFNVLSAKIESYAGN